QWSEFSECCSNLFIQHNIPLLTDTQENINTTWYKIQLFILELVAKSLITKFYPQTN
ncbi:43601_t:CDS:1, partial [Gigaspora margarita]